MELFIIFLFVICEWIIIFTITSNPEDVEARAEKRGEIKGAVRIYRTEMGLKPNEIMPKIMSQFNISEKAARKYVKNTIGEKA